MGVRLRWGSCMLGGGGWLLAKLGGSGVLHVHEPLLEASIEVAGKLAPGRQSGHVSGSWPSRLPRARLRRLSVASLCCLAGRGGIAGWGVMDG
jgi:hypothetical protein